MRLIDADALMRTLGITDTDCGKCDLHGAMGCSKKGGFVDACVAIEHAPIIEERKKGRWLRKENEWNLWYECSICGEKAPRDSIGRPWDRSDYCPNCGSYNGGGEDG